MSKYGKHGVYVTFLEKTYSVELWDKGKVINKTTYKHSERDKAIARIEYLCCAWEVDLKTHIP